MLVEDDPVAKNEKIRWGEWIQQRSQFVGFKRQQDLAEAVGCAPERLSRWAQLLTPPKRMLKGFDRTLAAALQTTRQILFQDYASTSPDSAPIILHGDHWFKGARADRMHALPVDTMLEQIISSMDMAERERMIEYGSQMILAKNDRRRAAVEKVMNNFGSLRIQTLTQTEFEKLKAEKIPVIKNAKLH